MATATAAPEKDEAAETMVEKFKAEATARLNELNEELAPKLKESSELQAALDSLSRPSSDGESPEEPSQAPAPQRRRRKGGTRADEFVKIVSENPGITVSEIARIMGLPKPNYLYRVAESVVKDKRVKKEGTGYIPSGK